MSDAETNEVTPLYRHPLKLPRGSVRATLVLMILAPFWVLMLYPNRLVPVPMYLYFLAGLVLVFFAAHGTSVEPKDQPQPGVWYLPHGVFRFLVLFGTIALLGYMIWAYPLNDLKDRLQPEYDDRWPYLLFSLFAGYGFGWAVGALLGKNRNLPWVQDVQASVSLLAMVLLFIDTLIQLFVKPNLEDKPNLFLFECVLTGIVAWYFGVRS